jgi:hypothetical protein
VCKVILNIEGTLFHVSEFVGLCILLELYVQTEVEKKIYMKNENTGYISCLATVMYEIILAVKGLGIYSGTSAIIPEQITLEMERKKFA